MTAEAPTEASESNAFGRPLTPSEHRRTPARRTLPFEDRPKAEFKEGIDALTLLLTDPRRCDLQQALHALYQTELAGLDVFGRALVHASDWAKEQEQEQGGSAEDIVPWGFELAYARILWDEVRHSELARAIAHNHDIHLGDFVDGFRRDGIQESPLSMDPAITSASINSGGEGMAMNLFSALISMAQELEDADMEVAFDFNHADEMMHVSVGDHWVPRLTENDPERRKVALMAQQAFEDNVIAMQDGEHVPGSNIHMAF